jgi:hypothetical protein
VRQQKTKGAMSNKMSNIRGKRGATKSPVLQAEPVQATPAASTPVTEEATRQSYIVQNQLPSPLSISDIRLTFAPFEAMDLTWEMTQWTRQSQDLRNAIRKGMLRRITDDEFEVALEEEAEAEYAEMIEEEARQDRMNNVNTEDGDSFEAEHVDVMKPASRGGSPINIRGQANDPVSYATAYDYLRESYEDQGHTLSPRQFRALVDKDKDLVSRILGGNMLSGVTSGVTGRGRATYATAPGAPGGRMGHRTTPMSNYGRDNYLAGAGDDFGFMPPPRIANHRRPGRESMPLGEEIDLLDS